MAAIRVGDIKFLNSWPVTYALREKLVPARKGGVEVQIVSGPPSELNRKMLTGELDAGAVSSMMFLRHPEEFVPVPGLCIRSDSGVASVLVVSRQPLESMVKGAKIGVSNQGATTPVLLKMLLNRRGLTAKLEPTGLRYPQILQEYPAALLIGDEALQASQESKDFSTWDLGEAWSSWTKLPFVYALWVVRRRLVDQQPDLLDEISRSLHASLAWGRAHQRELILRMQESVAWEASFIRRYLDRLSYDLDAKAWSGLKRFAEEAKKIGELRPITLSLSKGEPVMLRQAQHERQEAGAR